VSKVSEISGQYQAALSHSQAQYAALLKERAAATAEFYGAFFKNLVRNFHEEFSPERTRERLQERLERTFSTKSLQFVAIDGTCRREVFSDLVTFFGGAYGARGEIDLNGGGHRIRYKRWSLNHDVSMVAWVPVPFARLEEVTSGRGEQFLVTEDERINLSSVHIQLMQLSEVFLAYNSVRSSQLDAPHVLLMDLSPSSVLASVARAQDSLGLVGYPYDRRALTAADVAVAVAQPMSEPLGIPSTKKMDLYRVLIAELFRNANKPLDLPGLADRLAVPEPSLRAAAEYLVKTGVLRRPSIVQPSYSPAIRVDESWAYTRDFFQNICTKLFLKKDPAALQYDASDSNGIVRRRWLAPDDLGFLIGVGMRLLIEECWRRKVLFYGIAKDSSSSYLTRNYLGVCLETGFYPELGSLAVGPLPWTDRLFCETLPFVDTALAAPWGTIEFDSAFMTLHRERDPVSGHTQVAGVMGRIVNQEHLFAKSLAQFFLKREKKSPLMGHVVFVERLLSPGWDLSSAEQRPDEILIDNPEIGRMSAYTWRDGRRPNPGQAVMMYLLSVLTRNHYAEAIGYPDPLHKADWGAKTVGRGAGEMIGSSMRLLDTNPLARTFRSIRDGGGR
jgi:hypothetical protein